MTEEQGDRIIELLETVVSKLDNIESHADGIENHTGREGFHSRDLKEVLGQLRDIESSIVELQQ